MALWGSPNNQIGSTQEHLKFAEIHESMVITKTGEIRAILMASSINFSLKSEQEQNAIIFAYQNFLNSLEFPIQILLQSRKLDLTKYLAKLKEIASKQTNELLKMQTEEYIDFIGKLINFAHIMDKKFYVVIPFAPPPKIQPAGNLLKAGRQAQTIQISIDEFHSYKQELEQRVQVVQSGLGSVGIRSEPLNTQQIIELFYGIYNPEESIKEKLTDYENLTSSLVESEIEKPPEKKKENEQP